MSWPGHGGGPGSKPPFNAPGQRPLPGQAVCKFCEAPLTPHQAAKGQVCDAPRCEMRRVQEASRAVFQRDWGNFINRQRDAVEATAPQIGQAASRLGLDPAMIAIGTVPRQERPTVPLPEHRREEFAAHLDEIVAKGFAEGEPEIDLAEREREERAEDPLIDATCATCQGKCCILGGPAHAFLTGVNVQQFRARNPGATAQQIKAHYLGRLPNVSVEHSCVYHGPRGCVLDRTERGDVCNRYHCNPQTQLLKSFREMKAEAAIIIATEDNAGPAVSTYQSTGGLRLLENDPDMGEFAEDLAPDPALVERAVSAAMAQIPNDFPTQRSSIPPEVPSCKWCGKEIDAHKAVTTQSCGGASCEGQRIAAASEAVASQKQKQYLDLKNRIETAYANELNEAAAALAIDPKTMLVGVVPHQNMPLVPLPAERFAAFEAHLDATIAEGFAIDPEEYDDSKNRAAVDGPEPPIADAACATCQGSCCKPGAAGHAFIDKWMVARYRRTDPNPTPEGFKSLYLGMLPDKSVEDGCVYQSEVGCTMPRELRSTICNTFMCRGVKVLIDAAERTSPDCAAIVAQKDGEPRALGLFQTDQGWQPFIQDSIGRVLF